MLKNFKIELREKVEISVDGNVKNITSVEISKPVVKYRNQYINFYQLLTKSIMSSRPSDEDRKRVSDEEDLKDEEKEEFNIQAATAVGTMHLSDQIIKELFRFLSIGDKENAVCRIFGEKISDLELDLLKDKLEDIDLATIVGGITMYFLPLMQLKMK